MFAFNSSLEIQSDLHIGVLKSVWNLQEMSIYLDDENVTAFLQSNIPYNLLVNTTGRVNVVFVNSL